MTRLSRLKRMFAEAHINLCLRWPTLLAITASQGRRQRPPGSMESVLLVRLDGLGDCILTLPLVESLHQCFSHARLTVLTTPTAAPLFQALPAIHRVVVLHPAADPRWPKYLRSLLGALRTWVQHLRGHRFDAVLLPRWDADIYHGTLLCALTRAPVRIGYADATTAYKLRTCKGFQRAWTTVLPPGPLRHEAWRALQTAAPLGCATCDAHVSLLLLDAQCDAARAWLQTFLPASTEPRMLIAVGLPAAEAKKRWPPDLYLKALREIAIRTPAAMVFFADAETAEAARMLHAALPASCVALQMPLLLGAAVLAECSAFVGADSGLGHLAAAVGCPTVTLFAQASSCGNHIGWYSNSPERFRPLSAHGVVLQPEQARSGCAEGCCASEPHCILDISPGRVVDAVTSLLPQPAERKHYTGS